MGEPTNKSYQGLITWAKQNPGQRQPSGNDVNADTLDGMHYSDLQAEFATSGSGGGVVSTGTATFAGAGSYRRINLNPTMPDQNYVVIITPEANTSSFVGEHWITNKNTTYFDVYNAGSSANTVTFRWAVATQSDMPDLSAYSAGGDLSGTYPNPTISQKGAAVGEVLKWNGSAWLPAPDSAGGGLNALAVGTITINTAASQSSASAGVAIPGLLATDLVFATISDDGNMATYHIREAKPSAGYLTITIDTSSSLGTNGVVVVSYMAIRP